MKKKIDVKKHILSPTSVAVGVENSSGIQLFFNFDEHWDDMTCRISFETQLGVINLELGNDNTIAMPIEIMEHAGAYEYILTGTKDGQTLVTIPGFVKVLPSGIGVSSDLLPGFNSLQQLFERLEQLEEAVRIAGEIANTANQTANRANHTASLAINAVNAAEHAAFLAYHRAITAEEIAQEALRIAQNN